MLEIFENKSAWERIARIKAIQKFTAELNEIHTNAVEKYKINSIAKEMIDKEIAQHRNSDSRQIEINKNAQSLVKSFAEKLKSQLSFGLEDKIPANVYSFVYVTIENLVKEMVGEQE